MSMYRQLWLAVIVSMLVALAGSLVASSLSARIYLSEQLAMKNTDNAAALALSLSLREPDAVEVELAVSALFDSGHYELIRVTDPLGKTLVERRAAAGYNGAPAWFARLLPIVSQPGQAQISSGWKQFGTVQLVSHSRFAYEALWRSVWDLAGALFVATLIGGYLGTLILRRLRAPLAAVIGQAKAITERRFVTIEEPAVPELRQLATAMNATVGRLKTMFDEEAARLDAVRREANCDVLTGLANRSHFLARLHDALEAEDSRGIGLILVRVADLAGINRRMGREATDDLLRRFAAVLGKAGGQHPDCLAARLNGADFALLIAGQSGVREQAESLLQALVQEAAAFVADAPAAYIGMGVFPRGIELSAALSQVDAALAAAEAEGDNAIREAGQAVGEDAPRSADEWSRLIRHALDERWVKLISFPVADFNGRLIHRECPLRLMLDDHGEWLPAGRFLPIAERLRLTSRLDLSAVALGLAELADKPTLKGLAVNLSASSLQDKDFRVKLQSQLRQHGEPARRLWLEVAENGALSHFDDFRDLCMELKACGCRVGIEHFGRQFSQIGLLHGLGLDYIKVDASFVRGLEASPGNQAFLKGLCSIVHGIGIQVIAEGVVSEAELQALAGVGFDGATGPAVKESA
ncbi:MAG: GGDEF domain-containing protein [Betaproteobacteria bacterium HGW-Betaproteobacteria-14]|nr:MAG: GGDEF domain-containing protein [Betaproteobacteria bacterium HGW-Betaproteobacteria-14]